MLLQGWMIHSFMGSNRENIAIVNIKIILNFWGINKIIMDCTEGVDRPGFCSIQTIAEITKKLGLVKPWVSGFE